MSDTLTVFLTETLLQVDSACTTRPNGKPTTLKMEGLSRNIIVDADDQLTLDAMKYIVAKEMKKRRISKKFTINHQTVKQILNNRVICAHYREKFQQLPRTLDS